MALVADELPTHVRPGSQAALIGVRAIERGIDVEFRDNALVVLTHGGSTHRFRRGKTTLNRRLAEQVASQKEVTAALLRHRGISAPDNALFGDEDRAWRWAEPILPVVLKPNAAGKGKLVHVGVADRETFSWAFGRVAAGHGRVLVEEQMPGTEHRFSVIGGRVAAVTERVPMHVVGDGTSSVVQLIEAKNTERARRRNAIHTKLTVDDEVLRILEGHGWSLGAVPGDGETVWLRRTSNISIGGDAVDRTDDVDPNHITMVERAARAIPGLRVAGFDVLVDGDQAAVLEVNAAPMLSMHWLPWRGQRRDVYSRLLDVMFPETRTH